MTETETAAWRKREQIPGPWPPSPSTQAVLFALRELTGLDGPPQAAYWEGVLATRPRPASLK